MSASAPDTIEKKIAQYVAVRDKLRQIDAAHKDFRKDFTDALERLGAQIAAFINQNGLDNIKSASGTAYITHRSSASIADATVFMKFVIDGQHWDLLDKRANATAVEAYALEHKVMPPGLNFSKLEDIGVRRPNAK